MEIPERDVEQARAYLDIYRGMRDEITDDAADEWAWQSRWRFDSMARAVENVLDALGIAHD